MIIVFFLLGFALQGLAIDQCYWDSFAYARNRTVKAEGSTVMFQESLATANGDIQIQTYFVDLKKYRDEYWTGHCIDQNGNRYEDEIEVRYRKLVSTKPGTTAYSLGVRFFGDDEEYKRSAPRFEDLRVILEENGELVTDSIFETEPFSKEKKVLATVKNQISDSDYGRLEELLGAEF